MLAYHSPGRDATADTSEARPHHHVSTASQDWPDDLLDLERLVLAVAVNQYERVDGHAARVRKGGADGRRLALVTGMSNELGARRGSDIRGAIGRTIVHDHHLVTG